MERSNSYINQYQQYMKIDIPEFLDSGQKRWTLDSGRQALDAGLWTLGSGPSSLDAGLWELNTKLSQALETIELQSFTKYLRLNQFSSFHMKSCTTGKVQFLFFMSFFPSINKIFNLVGELGAGLTFYGDQKLF